jgi:hypothetical protein
MLFYKKLSLMLLNYNRGYYKQSTRLLELKGFSFLKTAEPSPCQKTQSRDLSWKENGFGAELLPL